MRPLKKQRLRNTYTTFRAFKKRLRINDIKTEAYKNHVVFHTGQFLACVCVLPDGYFSVHTLPLTGFQFRFPASNFSELCLKLLKYKIVSYKLFNILVNDTKYFRRNSKFAYSPSGELYWFKIVAIKDVTMLEQEITVERNDGKIFTFKKQSFYVLFTPRPKYPLVLQLKMF